MDIDHKIYVYIETVMQCNVRLNVNAVVVGSIHSGFFLANRCPAHRRVGSGKLGT